MFKKILTIALFLLAACNRVADDRVQVTMATGVLTPSSSSDVRDSFSTALSCDVSQIVFSIQEASTPGFVSPRDGNITSLGVYTSPSCGSIYVGAIQHIVATGCGKTGVAAIASAQEVLNSLSMAVAIVAPGTANECTAQNPQCVGNPLCLDPAPSDVGIPLGTVVQFYARTDFTCSSVYSPGPPPSPLPPQCANY